jgi:tetratricopeptide (TPR) repeat protein
MANGRRSGLVLLVAALLACKGGDKSAPPATTGPAPTASAPVTPGVCPTGASMDPGEGEFRPAVTAFKEKDYKTAQRLLDHLAKQYPNSATVRVWRGDSALFDKGVKEDEAAASAIPFYNEAEKLHDQGCVLPEYEHYYLRMGVAYAHLRKKAPDEALRHLEIARRKWDNSAEVFYHLARAHCAKNQVDPCVADFEKCLEIAKSLRRPKFLRSHHSVDDWIRRSQTQSEFGPLRKDKRYAAAVKKAKAEP